MASLGAEMDVVEPSKDLAAATDWARNMMLNSERSYEGAMLPDEMRPRRVYPIGSYSAA